MKKILILSKVNDHRLRSFSQQNRIQTNVETVTATYESFNGLINGNKVRFFIETTPLEDFDAIYCYKMFGFEEIVTLINCYLSAISAKTVLFDKAVQSHSKWIDRKSWEYLTLSSQNFPVIPTHYTFSQNAQKCTASFPCIAKQTYLSEGKGVWLCQSQQELIELTAKFPNDLFLVQPFVKNQGDIRAIVIGDKVLGTMLRKNDKDYRNNIALGGSGKVAKVDEAVEQLAINVANCLGYTIAGVDLIQDTLSREWFIMEVNKGPNFDGFDEILKLDTAHEIVSFIAGSLKN